MVKRRRSRRILAGTYNVGVTAGSIFSSVTFSSMMLMDVPDVASPFVIPGQQGVDFGWVVAVRDGAEHSGQPGMGVDGAHLAGPDRRGDHCPVLRPGVVAREEGAFIAVQRDGADGAFDGNGIHFDAAVVGDPGQPVPVLGDVFAGSAERGFGGNAGAGALTK